MNAIARSALTLALTLAVALGSAGTATPAQATFADSEVRTTAVSTATVATAVAFTGNLTCGKSSATMSATWSASPSPRVTGYLITVTFSDGFVQTVQKAATDTSWSAPINLGYVSLFSVQYSITTQTAYGWTTESPQTASFKC
jgi:hypothetical protein